MSSQLKETLKNLCCNNGWCYGVFWRVNRRNSMLLTLGDAYFEEQIGFVIDQMLQQVHMLGEGVIGKAAFTGKHQWMFSDTYGGDWCPTGSVDNQDVFQDNSHFPQQFSSGIKTIAVISVAPEGVVQFGSRHKILERLDFVDHIKSTFRQLGSVEGSLLGNALATGSELYNPSEAVPGVSCSNYWNIKTMHNNNFKELTGQSQPGMSISHSSPFNVELQNESMTSMISNSSFQTNGQFQTSDIDTQAISSLPNMHSQQVFSQLASSSANHSSARYPSMSTWSSEYSTLTSFEPHTASVVGRQESPNAFPADTHGLTCKNIFQNFQRDATYASYDTSGFLNTTTGGEFLEVNKPTGVGSGKLLDVQKSFQLIHPIEGDLSKDSASFQSFLGENPVNNLSQWLIQPLEDCSRLVTPMDDNHSQTLGVTVASCSSGLAGDDVFNGVPVINANASAQISVSNTLSSLNLLCDGKQNLSFPIQLPTDSDLFDSLGLTFDQNQGRECWDNILLPVGSGSNSNLSNGNSECVSELDVGSTSGPQKGFFVEFGLEQLLDSVAGTKPSSEDQLPAATARTGSTSVYGNQIQFAGLSCCGPNMNGLLPESDPPKMTMHSNLKEALPKSQVGLWIDDTYSINTESAVTTQPMKSEEAAKAPKKRARPGESTRPRPKDRQQIQDRVKELRDIVPNGAKCSIDALLDRTIKHMLFLQSVTKYADKLKQADEPKMIGDENGVVLKDNSNGTGGGATWAFEIGGQTMVCPIIVEDLNPPGQMLVEMLCEERGFFLEIADIIRGFGLTILKGVMEVREDKIWARFAVEANRNVTRMDIFLSLVQLLQQTATATATATAGGISSSNQPSKAAESSIPLFNNYHQNPLKLPISLADRLQ